jgi:hypothetical protein
VWSRLAWLPLAVEGCEYERLQSVLACEFQRITTQVRLVGAGADGLGEDVSVFREDGTALHETRPSVPLEGEWTLAGSAIISPVRAIRVAQIANGRFGADRDRRRADDCVPRTLKEESM